MKVTHSFRLTRRDDGDNNFLLEMCSEVDGGKTTTEIELFISGCKGDGFAELDVATVREEPIEHLQAALELLSRNRMKIIDLVIGCVDVVDDEPGV